MTEQIDLERARGDTDTHVFIVTKADGVTIVNIAAWTAWRMTVDPEKAPVDAVNNVFQSAGSLVTDGTDGKVQFAPPGDSAIGRYYYDVQGINTVGGKRTIANGKYKIVQDITKD